MCFVEVTETGNLHPVDTIVIADIDVEITHDEGGEVETGHLEEQLVLIQ